MQNLFIPYSIALQLKEIGFDEPCLFVYSNKQLKSCSDMWDQNDKNHNQITNHEYANDVEITAPLFEQVLNWFEDLGYQNYVASNSYDGKVNYWFAITAPGLLTFTDATGRKTKKDAQIACIRKLIEFKKDEANYRLALAGV